MLMIYSVSYSVSDLDCAKDYQGEYILNSIYFTNLVILWIHDQVRETLKRGCLLSWKSV